MLDLAAAASRAWGLGSASITLVAQRENTTFKISTSAGQHYALRLHRPGYHQRPQLEAELKWLQYLFEQGIAVPAPVASLEGCLIEQVEDYYVSVLQWLNGLPMGQTGTPLELKQGEQVFYTLGQGMAEVHAASDRWDGASKLARPHWDVNGLLGDNPLWGVFWQSPALTTAQKTLFAKTKSCVKAKLEECSSDLDYGLIHADLVRENIMLHKHEMQLIDFDDSGFGFRLFELATCLLANANEPNYDVLKTQLIAGYHSVRPLNITHLQSFMLIRSLTYVGWIVPRMHELGGLERCQRFIQRAQDLSEDFLHIECQ